MEVRSLNGRTCVRGETEHADVRWFDVAGPDDPALDELAQRFHLHPLAVEDCRSLRFHAPKIDDFGDYLFLVFQVFVRDADGNPEPQELNAFLGSDFLIAYQDSPIAAVEQVRRDLDSGVALRPGADGLLYAILDRAVDDLLPMSDDISSQLDAIQEQVVSENWSPAVQLEILALRSRAGEMRRVLASDENVLLRLSHGEFPQVTAANRIYLRDVYDHLVRLAFALEQVRDDCEMALSTFLSVVNNRLSEVMKVLSVVGALALPASVIAGIFGTNFDNVPGLHSNAGFFVMLGGMAVVAASMALYFRRRGWF